MSSTRESEVNKLNETIKNLEKQLAEQSRIKVELENSDRDSIDHKMSRFRYFIEQTSEGFYREESEQPIPTSLPYKEQIKQMYACLKIAECNDLFAQMYGYPNAGALEGVSVEILHGRADVPENIEATKNFIQNGYKLIDAETKEVNKNGETIYFLNNAVGIIENDHLVSIWGTQRNITERKRTQHDIETSRQKMALHVEKTPLAVIEWDLNFEVTSWNPAAERIFGYRSEEAKGQHASFIVPKITREHVDKIWADLLTRKGGERSTNQNNTKDGKIIFCEWYNTPLIDAKGNVIGVASLVMDVTEHKVAEDALRESEEKYRNLIDQSNDAIYLLFDRRFEIVNKKFLSIFELNLSDVNKPSFDFMELVAEESRGIIEDRIKRQARGEEIEPKYEFTAVTVTGKKIIVEASITHIPFKGGVAAQGILRDITERQRLEEQFRQAQKMEAVGLLAGGVAHDFNNLLTVISGYSDLLLMDKNLGKKQIEKISEISKAGNRAQQLTNQLLAFSRKQIFKPEVINLNNVISNSMNMFTRLIGEDIQIKLNLNEDLPSILADPHQLEQILINLIVNARDAIYENKSKQNKKHITIETSVTYLDDTFSFDHLGTIKGKKILLSLNDTGIGMSKTTLAKIFEPFFTTKGLGKGTGLGLSTVYGIVKQNNANIYPTSEPVRAQYLTYIGPSLNLETNLMEQTIKKKT